MILSLDDQSGYYHSMCGRVSHYKIQKIAVHIYSLTVDTGQAYAFQATISLQ